MASPCPSRLRVPGSHRVQGVWCSWPVPCPLPGDTPGSAVPASGAFPDVGAHLVLVLRVAWLRVSGQLTTGILEKLSSGAHVGHWGECGTFSQLGRECLLGLWITYGFFLASVSSAQTQKPYTRRCHFPLSKSELLQRQVISWPGHSSCWRRAEVLVATAWPLVLAFPELKRLDLQG